MLKCAIRGRLFLPVVSVRQVCEIQTGCSHQLLIAGGPRVRSQSPLPLSFAVSEARSPYERSSDDGWLRTGSEY